MTWGNVGKCLVEGFGVWGLGMDPRGSGPTSLAKIEVLHSDLRGTLVW